jgi:hypothetical protein
MKKKKAILSCGLTLILTGLTTWLTAGVIGEALRLRRKVIETDYLELGAFLHVVPAEASESPVPSIYGLI